MRFLSLRFERYGAFADRALELSEDASLHVVLGRNEAGKSTALNAIGDLLFGFPHTTAFAFQHEPSSLRVGARLRLATGALLSIRRRKGRSNTLIDENDKPLGDDFLDPVLGAVTREMFFSELGLTAQALRDGGRDLLQAGGRLAETLAAASTRLAALSQLRAKLAAEADDLFGPRRVASKPFYLASDRWQAAEKSLRDRIVTTDALAAAEAAVTEAREKRAALGAAHDENQRALTRGERALRTRAKLKRLELLRDELQVLASLPPVDATTLAQWRAALEEDARIAAEAAEQQAAAAEDDAAIAALRIDEPLLSRGSEIDALRERLGAVRKAEEDLPRRRERKRSAQDDLMQSAQGLGLATEEELLARPPSVPALARLRELIGDRATAERRLDEAKIAEAEAKREAEALEAAEARQGGAVDPAPLLQRFLAFADVPADADRLRRERFAVAQERGGLEEEALRLDPCAGDISALARRPLPDAAEIDAAGRAFEALDEDDKRIGAERKNVSDRLTAIDEEIAALTQAGAIATRDDLARAREARERAYLALGASLDGAAPQRREDYLALGVAEREADAAADLLLSDAERATRLASARERRAKEARGLAALDAAAADRLAKEEAARRSWADLWAPSGVTPKPPARMASWVTRAKELLQRRARLDEREPELAALAQKLDEQRSSLSRLLQDAGAEGDAAMPAEALYKLARAALDQMQAAWTDARTALALRDKAARTLARASAETAARETEAQRLRAIWPDALAAIGLADAAGVAEAEAALAIWQGVPLQKEKFLTEQRRVETMQDDIAAFEQAVSSLVAATAADLAKRPPREALDLLSRRLSLARAAREKRDALREAAQKREALRLRLAQRRDATRAALNDARGALTLAPEEPLGAAFERVARRNACAAERDAVSRDLVDIADGLDEAALSAEQSDLDFDILPGAIERLRIDSRQLLDDLQEAAKAEHDAIRVHDALAEGRDAAGAARERAEAGAELVAVATRWLRRAAAARLAGLAIERHRAAVEDPLIKRASELFAIATDGAFARLAADYDKDDRPTLVGLRANGAKVEVSGMSEGARDQLFLSLRLALLELRGGEPLPFLGDDLLASFDEPRTARALELLAEFGKARQAILFTHHRHVAEIAAGLSGVIAEVIEL